jgi:ribosomal protein L20A (L18A)
MNTFKSFKVAGYKIDTQKSVVFLYIIDQLTEKENVETTPFTIASKNKVSMITLTKQVKDCCGKKLKTAEERN